MQGPEQEINLRDYLRIIIKRKRLITVVCLFLFLVVLSHIGFIKFSYYNFGSLYFFFILLFICFFKLVLFFFLFGF